MRSVAQRNVYLAKLGQHICQLSNGSDLRVLHSSRLGKQRTVPVGRDGVLTTHAGPYGRRSVTCLNDETRLAIRDVPCQRSMLEPMSSDSRKAGSYPAATNSCRLLPSDKLQSVQSFAKRGPEIQQRMARTSCRCRQLRATAFSPHRKSGVLVNID